MGVSKEDGNYVIARISPAYQSGALTDHPAMLISGIIGVALIVVTEYLIIYNIFQISVIQDIQSYGQLKTPGTTKLQIKPFCRGKEILPTSMCRKKDGPIWLLSWICAAVKSSVMPMAHL